MLDLACENLSVAAGDWLKSFERLLTEGDWPALGALFAEDSYWRNVLAFSWEIETHSGTAAIIEALRARAPAACARQFRVDAERTPVRRVSRAGTEAIEAIFAFETELGRGDGIVRLIPDPQGSGDLKAWTLLTALEELKGHEERLGKARPTDEAYSRDFHGPNWLDQRNHSVAYEDRDPAVLVVGGGQAGLSIAARLTQLGVDTLVVDRNARVGDNWRNRYHALTLHNQVQVNHLPYMPFPPNFPTYIPKDKLANWFESYVDAMEINFWTGTDFRGGIYDETKGTWSVTLHRSDGSSRDMQPRHVILATGVSDVPHIPDIPTFEAFKGEVIHAGSYTDGEDWKGRDAVVIGSGNSGHDIAQDLHSSGARVTMVQRSPTMVVNIEPGAQIPYTLYEEGPPTEDCDLISTSMPTPVARLSHRLITAQARELDRELLEGLDRVGFRYDFGDDGSGWQFKYLTRGGGYYFNVGCSDLIADGKIGLVQNDDIETFTAGGLRLKSGNEVGADLVVLATGYKGQTYLVRHLFGDAVADRVGPVWGFGDGLELRNMYVRTGQPGLWFIAGSLAQSRIWSKYLALQIKAIEEGLLSASNT